MTNTLGARVQRILNPLRQFARAALAQGLAAKTTLYDFTLLTLSALVARGLRPKCDQGE